MNGLGHDKIWRDLPAVCTWYESIKAQPAYKKTYHKSTRLTEVYDGANDGMDDDTATVVND